MAMHYQGNIIRPPSEADSIILQVTVGCSHNKCTFCGAYKGELFQIRDDATVDGDLEFAARHCRRLNRVFLAAGDALIIPQERLVTLLLRIREKLPWIRRISLYANVKGIMAKSPTQLAALKSLGLDRVYMGLESGHDPTLTAIRKGADSRMMIEAARRIREARLFLSVTVLLGIGGMDNSQPHAEATGRVLSAMAPNQIAALTLMLLENTPLARDALTGVFRLPGHWQLLRELQTMVAHIDLDRAQFQANHASNYLPINGRLGRDKAKILDLITRALAGDIQLTPEVMRAL
jgi:radical SAM superfamily enzyme YgiQ (UPF0313 family)